MTNYIDGFVHALPRDQLEDYQRLVEAVATIWKEHGALAYWESVGDDLYLEGTRSFVDLVGAREDDVLLFGWVLFASREARDLANKRVAADPRMEKLMAESNVDFDARRMAFGGFKPFVYS